MVSERQFIPEDDVSTTCTFRTYRDFVNDTGQDVVVEAGPNGPENVRSTKNVVVNAMIY